MDEDGTIKDDLKLPDNDLGSEIRAKYDADEEVVVRLFRHLQTLLNMLKNLYWGLNSIFSVIYAHDMRGSKICKFGGHVGDLCL